MKTGQLLALTLVLCMVLLGGCNHTPTPAAGNFTVVPQYGSPGAYSIDTQAYLFGSTAGGYACDPQTDSYCQTSFQYAVASTTANPQGFTEVTDAVGNVDWTLSGNSSSNCSAGYPAVIDSVQTQTSYDLTCGSPTTDFASSEPSWIVGNAPSTVTFTAINSAFPSKGFSTATTVYDTSENVQWSGSVAASSTTQITVPISNTAVGTHILVFRNPSNNSVIGSSAYVVFAEPGSGGGGGGAPCSRSRSGCTQ